MTDRQPAQDRKTRRGRSSRPDVSQALLASATTEFATKGFEGASTVAIAKAANAHQPQINYHFGSKLGLWKSVVERLHQELLRESAGIDFETDAGAGFADLIQRFVDFSSRRPELFQIVLNEGTLPSERLDWLAELYLTDVYELIKSRWRQLRAEGVAAPIDERLIYHHLVGAVSLIFVAEAEAHLLLGPEASSEDVRQAHVAGLISTMLPGLSG